MSTQAIKKHMMQGYRIAKVGNPRENQPHQVQLPDHTVEKVWSLTGLAAIPVLPYRMSIHTKPLGYKFTSIQGGASTPVTWTSDSIVTMTTVCHYHVES